MSVQSRLSAACANAVTGVASSTAAMVNKNGLTTVWLRDSFLRETNMGGKPPFKALCLVERVLLFRNLTKGLLGRKYRSVQFSVNARKINDVFSSADF